MSSGLERAIKAAGGLTPLADRMKVLPQVVNNWRRRGIPAARVLEICKATEDANGIAAVRPHELRPDLYPKARVA